MYQYKFVKIDLPGIYYNKAEEDYREVVYEHAREGWRLFQILTSGSFGYGTSVFLELIFERSTMDYH